MPAPPDRPGMEQSTPTVTSQAIGSVPEESDAPARCMFCQTPLRDEGPAWIDHVAQSQACADAYESWLDNLDYDRHGGG